MERQSPGPSAQAGGLWSRQSWRVYRNGGRVDGGPQLTSVVELQLGRWLGPGELPGCGAVADGELVEPAASRISGRAVEASDVRLEVDDGRPVQEIDAGEHDGLTGHLQELDEAEPDRVDPPRPAGGEDAHRALLAAEQERDLPQWRVARRVARAVQPAEQPGVAEIREPVQAVPVRLDDLDGAVLGAVETGLDRRGLQLLVAGPDHADHGQADGEFHVHHAVTGWLSRAAAASGQRVVMARGWSGRGWSGPAEGGASGCRRGTVRLMAGTPGRASGSLMRNWQPGPALRTAIWPECASTMPRAIESPSPAPSCGPGVRADSPRNATSNTRGRSPGGIPPQASDTLTQAIPLCTSASTSTPPSDGVCLIALVTRLRRARPISAESTKTGMPRTAAPVSRTPLCRATGSALATTSATRSSSPTMRLDSRSAPAWMRDSSNRSSIIKVSRSTSRRICEWYWDTSRGSTTTWSSSASAMACSPASGVRRSWLTQATSSRRLASRARSLDRAWASRSCVAVSSAESSDSSAGRVRVGGT